MRLLKALPFILILSLVTPVALADVDLERANLARMIREIEFLLAETKTMEAQAPDNVRIRFRYDLLREDLIRMRQAIADHINDSLDSARPVEPLHQMYRR
jgi:RAQPRD family integrative conjugative element protein